jgi:hypothetical protein
MLLLKSSTKGKIREKEDNERLAGVEKIDLLIRNQSLFLFLKSLSQLSTMLLFITFVQIEILEKS